MQNLLQVTLPNYQKYEYLYRVNGWQAIGGQWVDVNGNGFTPESVAEAERLYGTD